MKIKQLIAIIIICALFGYCAANLELDPQTRRNQHDDLIERMDRIIDSIKGDYGR